MAMVYYNEIDRDAARWLRNLMDAGLIPKGEVDERSIKNVNATDLVGFRTVHLFAGVGGWPLALRLAGWTDRRPIWSGSCPCQPFSAAGKQESQEDERHLWPDMFRLIAECRPPIVIGEQVDGAIGHGWLDGVQSDMEAEDYAFGAAVLPAASYDSPTRRYRLWWMAESKGERFDRGKTAEESKRRHGFEGNCVASKLADADQSIFRGQPRTGEQPVDESNRVVGVAPGITYGASASGEISAGRREPGISSGWSEYDLLLCRDGKTRRVESGTFPLAARISRDVGPLLAELEKLGLDPKSSRRIIREARRNRIVRLKGYGNSIVPQVAAVFIRAFMESR
jgi:DNA (cytosine-5)-methyltransferase 1